MIKKIEQKWEQSDLPEQVDFSYEERLVCDLIIKRARGFWNLKSAIQTAEKIKSERDQSQAFTAIAKAQAIAGNIANATQTAEKIKDEYNQSQAFAAIAEAQARVGDESFKHMFANAIQRSLWQFSRL